MFFEKIIFIGPKIKELFKLSSCRKLVSYDNIFFRSYISRGHSFLALSSYLLLSMLDSESKKRVGILNDTLVIS